MVADIYEALTANRPYRAGLSVEKALSILEQERGVKLDRRMVDARAACVQREPGGQEL